MHCCMRSVTGMHHWVAQTSVIAGGHSVWAALPPFPALPAQDPRPITLVTAAIDSTAFFHDLAKVPSCPHCCKFNVHPPGYHRNLSVPSLCRHFLSNCWLVMAISAVVTFRVRSQLMMYGIHSHCIPFCNSPGNRCSTHCLLRPDHSHAVCSIAAQEQQAGCLIQVAVVLATFAGRASAPVL